MAILINPSGRIIEIEQGRVEELIERGFTFADKRQKRTYYRKYKRKEPALEGEGLFFKENSSNPNGYGESTELLVQSLEDTGIEVAHRYTGQKVGMVYGYPQSLKMLETNKKILYSMFESTSIDPQWVPYLELADKVFVPSKFCQKAFATRKIKTEVIPLGYNQDEFYYKEKEDDGIFTFTMYNAFDLRKGWDILFNAFTEEFGEDEKVKLILKSVVRKLPFPIAKSEYPNVEVVLSRYSRSELRKLLWNTDCFVFPSRGEGFGLPPLEALACGTTSIVPNASGMSEYFDDDYFINLEIERLRPPIYQNFDLRVVGEMVEPSKKDLRKKMRWAYENRKEVWEMGKRGSKWVESKYPMKKTGILLAQELRGIGLSNKKLITISNPKQNKKTVAFFMKNRPIYSGGRIFCYQILHALSELNYDVTVYTNMNPVWEDDLRWNRNYKTVLVDKEEIRNLEVDADIYMGATVEGGIACARNGLRTGKDAYNLVFDPIPMIEKYDSDRLDGEKDAYFEVDNLIQTGDSITPVFLTKFAKNLCKDHYQKEGKVLQPCVNDKIADKYKNKRENIIVASATTGERDKGFEKALELFKKVSEDKIYEDWKFHIFTSSENSQLDKWIIQHNLHNKVIPHYDKDDNEKFEIFSKAKVLFCPSPYEGYGMWLAEGRYMGLECVVIENGVFREVLNNDKHIHMAKRDNLLDLERKLRKAMKVTKHLARKKEFKFDNLVNNLEKLLK